MARVCSLSAAVALCTISMTLLPAHVLQHQMTMNDWMDGRERKRRCEKGLKWDVRKDRKNKNVQIKKYIFVFTPELTEPCLYVGCGGLAGGGWGWAGGDGSDSGIIIRHYGPIETQGRQGIQSVGRWAWKSKWRRNERELMYLMIMCLSICHQQHWLNVTWVALRRRRHVLFSPSLSVFCMAMTAM